MAVSDMNATFECPRESTGQRPEMAGGSRQFSVGIACILKGVAPE